MAGVRDGEVVVAALTAANSLGFVYERDGRPLAVNRSGEEASADLELRPGRATTLVVVVTNAGLSKERAHLLSLAAHEGIDAAVRPSHTIWDGDAAFSLATGEVGADQATIEAMAREAVAESIRRAVRMATGVPGFPSVNELREEEAR